VPSRLVIQNSRPPLRRHRFGDFGQVSDPTAMWLL